MPADPEQPIPEAAIAQIEFLLHLPLRKRPRRPAGAEVKQVTSHAREEMQRIDPADIRVAAPLDPL
jgi:hypothetical protein